MINSPLFIKNTKLKESKAIKQSISIRVTLSDLYSTRDLINTITALLRPIVSLIQHGRPHCLTVDRQVRVNYVARVVGQLSVRLSVRHLSLCQINDNDATKINDADSAKD